MIERSLGTPDAQVVEATVAEAPRLFEEFFGEEHARLFGAPCFVTGDRHEAEENMQDAFLRMWERWDEVQFADPSAYLFRTAMNVFRNRYRRSVLGLRKTLGRHLVDGSQRGGAARRRHATAPPVARGCRMDHLLARRIARRVPPPPVADGRAVRWLRTPGGVRGLGRESDIVSDRRSDRVHHQRPRPCVA